MIGHVNISLCDPLNPGFGYQVCIESTDGRVLLFTSRDPMTSADLLTLSDVLRVVGMYAESPERVAAEVLDRIAMSRPVAA